MAFHWQFEPASGSGQDPVTAPATFPSQGDAESWLGENWRAMAAGGTRSARLLDSGRVVYDLPLTTPGARGAS